jgi:hypothetical protein
MSGNGNKNLKIIRSTEEARARGRAGGIASGRARRKKKTIRDTLLALRDASVEDQKQRKFLKAQGVPDAEMTYGVLVALSIINGAFKGNSQMAQLLLKALGELDADKLEVTGKNGAPLTAAPSVQIYLPENGR